MSLRLCSPAPSTVIFPSESIRVGPVFGVRCPFLCHTGYSSRMIICVTYYLYYGNRKF
jgi:hypothetical protein